MAAIMAFGKEEAAITEAEVCRFRTSVYGKDSSHKFDSIFQISFFPRCSLSLDMTFTLTQRPMPLTAARISG